MSTGIDDNPQLVPAQIEKERFHEFQKERYHQLQKEQKCRKFHAFVGEFMGLICDTMGEKSTRFDIRKLYMDV